MNILRGLMVLLLFFLLSSLVFGAYFSVNVKIFIYIFIEWFQIWICRNWYVYRILPHFTRTGESALASQFRWWWWWLFDMFAHTHRHKLRSIGLMFDYIAIYLLVVVLVLIFGFIAGVHSIWSQCTLLSLNFYHSTTTTTAFVSSVYIHIRYEKNK